MVRVEFRTGGWVALEALSEAPADVLADAVGLEVDEFLSELARWADGPGLIYGVLVDREKRTISRLGWPAKSWTAP